MHTEPLLATAQYTLRSGALQLGLTQAELDRLLQPERTLHVRFMLERDDGSMQAVNGWRVQHNLRRGAGKGGVRYSSNVNEAEVTGLATIMTLKNALAQLPYGGAKGGVAIDAGSLTETERDRLAYALAQAFDRFVGPDRDILGPDVGTGERDMHAFVRAWQEQTGSKSIAVATGKPLDAGGIEARNGATALGCQAAIAVARDRLSLSTSARVAIQGFGALGRGLAELLAEDGHHVVAVSDSSGGVYNPDGLDIAAVVEAKATEGTVTAADGESIGSVDVLTVDADIVVPAALQSVIDVDMASKIKAPLIVEGSNAPSTVDGLRRAARRGLTVVPDFAANAGGVIGSFFEWSANTGSETDDPRAAISERVTDLNNRMWDRSHPSVDLRTAAAAEAIEAVLETAN